MMHKLPRPIRKILVPIDGSENSIHDLHKAISFARDLSANITGLYVIPLNNSKSTSNDIIDLMGKAERIAMLQGVTLRNEILKGSDVGQTIANFADNEKFDMLIIGAKNGSMTRHKILGNISRHVVEATKTSVLILK